MSKTAAMLQHPAARLIPDTRNEQMNNVESVKKAFHESRITGEQLLSKGKITWIKYVCGRKKLGIDTMQAFVTENTVKCQKCNENGVRL